jgi:GrpB-like predicted nucleotidyltransferase (UPF0157 family)
VEPQAVRKRSRNALIGQTGACLFPGLSGKPVIDILVGVKNLPSSRESFDALAELDYQYAPYRAD